MIRRGVTGVTDLICCCASRVVGTKTSDFTQLMPQPALAHSGDGMDRSQSPEGKALPSATKPLPLSESEAEISSVPASTRSSFEQSRSSGLDRRSSFPVESTRSSDPRGIVLKAFLPRVAVYASQDTEELVRLKGVYGGLCGLLRPFGETIQGKVGIRDSIGLSKSWDEYGVHFTRFDGDQGQAGLGSGAYANVEDSIQEGDWSRILKATPTENGGISALDEVVTHSLDSGASLGELDEAAGHTPGYYNVFLRKMLADRPLVPYETFAHPVACVIAISSQTSDPIATLGDLYHHTGADSGNLPPWVNNSFLRYYVLVHDEDHDDITVSTALFAQMKRNFGLHCHMLRLRSIECTAQDSDGGPLPDCQWLPAGDDLADIKQKEGAAANELQQYIFDSDASVIRTFVRELVTQSIVPYMESRVTTWNDQVASRRRGVTGRIMSISKRWTGFGAARGRSSTPAADRDFDPSQGAYKPESNTATMHRLADYAVMLRDWKLASSIYDLLRSDFSDDKAWHHYAVAHEMAAMSMLLAGQSTGSRSRIDTINQLLDTASYSFITRCSSPREAIRCMVLAVELYINNAGTGAKEAARWGNRILELSILTPIIQVLLAERLVVANRSRSPYLDILQQSPFRKAALWNLLSAETWLTRQHADNAEKQLASALNVYGEPGVETEFASFEGTQDYLRDLRGKVVEMGRSITPTIKQETDTFIEDLAPSQLIASSGAPTRHGHSHSISHRRGLSHHAAKSVLPRIDDPLQKEDDGFT